MKINILQPTKLQLGKLRIKAGVATTINSK